MPGDLEGDGTKRGEKDLWLLPTFALSEAARSLREGDNPAAYQAKVAAWKDECSTYSHEIQDVVLGKSGKGDNQPFDPDFRCLLLLKIVEYIERFPEEMKRNRAESHTKTEFKHKVWEDMFAVFPDTDPLNREFPEQLAIAAYWDVGSTAFCYTFPC